MYHEKRYVATEEEADYYVNYVAATFASEGMDIPLAEKKLLKDFALGKVSCEEILMQMIAMHRIFWAD